MFHQGPMMEKKKEVPKSILKTVSTFYKESDAIFQEFDEIRSNYLEGRDIMADLKRFRSKMPSIFALIDGIYHKEVELEDKLDRAGVKEEERAKIAEFKTRFSDLADEIDILVLEELGLNR